VARINNVDVEKIRSFMEQVNADPSRARKTQVIEGEWVLRDGGPQFRSHVTFESGDATLETDNPTFMGGGGALPGPMHYCFYGLAACYTGVFAAAATELGVRLDSLTARVEADLNFAPVFGVSDEPIMEEVRVILNVVSSSGEAAVREAERLALERCPVVYTLRHQIRLVPSLHISAG
jgi:uncharacterized OsmC-like protein